METIRGLVLRHPGECDKDLAAALVALGHLHRDTQRNEEARADYREALQIQRQGAETRPEEFEEDMAFTLRHLGFLDRDCGRTEQALTELKESCEIFRRCEARFPGDCREALEETERALHGLEEGGEETGMATGRDGSSD